MNIELDIAQARVLGVLMEKEATTPDAYPLSINAIVTACNQKTNRDPVMELSEGEVQDAVDTLVAATLVRPASGSGGRVARYAHRLSARLFGEAEFSEAERAVLCVLLLRGPQTPGEIRARAGRLHAFESVQQAESVLAGLARRGDGPYVAELAREPGRREGRYVHLLGDSGAQPSESNMAVPERAPAPGGEATAGLSERVAALEAELEVLKSQVAHLREVVER